MRREKTIEVRTWPTKIRETVAVYAAGSLIKDEHELLLISKKHELRIDTLPRGVLVGTVNIVDCRRLSGEDSERACFDITEQDLDRGYAWILDEAKPFKEFVKPTRHPPAQLLLPLL